jgi:hypothetical protein
VNVSTTVPTTVQLKRTNLIGLIVAAAALAAVITWLLVGFAFDSGATRAPQSTSLTDAATTTAIRSLEPGQWPGPPPYPPGFRGMP